MKPLIRPSRRRRETYCFGCANMYYIRGASPLCVAEAWFKQGPLRKRIDVVGVVPAIRKNIANTCPHRTFASIQAYRLKRWMLGRLNNGSATKIKTARLKEFDYSKEADEIERFKNKGYNYEPPDFEDGEEAVSDPFEIDNEEADEILDGGEEQKEEDDSLEEDPEAEEGL